MEDIKHSDRIYISGPITGLAREEYIGRFLRAEQTLRSEGYTKIINPTRLPMSRWPWLYRLLGYRLTLLIDLWLLTRCRFIYKMPGWRNSHGAQIESCVAYHFGIWTVNKKLCEILDNTVGDLPSPKE